ncbi:MAG: hypothetical protein LBD86_01590 [Spirochaetaceae bacterium]|jgi:hypothetical protein|nr:hypothetical protein [Spirochaetaceae bacterium]
MPGLEFSLKIVKLPASYESVLPAFKGDKFLKLPWFPFPSPENGKNGLPAAGHGNGNSINYGNTGIRAYGAADSAGKSINNHAGSTE